MPLQTQAGSGAPPRPPPPVRKEHETPDEFYRRLFLTPLESASARETEQVRRTVSVLDAVDGNCTFEPEIQPRSRRLALQRGPAQGDAYIRGLIEENGRKLRARDQEEARSRSSRLDPLDALTPDCTFSPAVQGRGYRRRPEAPGAGVGAQMEKRPTPVRTEPPRAPWRARAAPGLAPGARDRLEARRGGTGGFQPAMYTPAYDMARGEDAILFQLSQMSLLSQGP